MAAPEKNDVIDKKFIKNDRFFYVPNFIDEALPIGALYFMPVILSKIIKKLF